MRIDRRSFGIGAAAAACATTTGCIGELEPRRSNTKRVHWKGEGKLVVGYFENWAQYRKRDCKFKVSNIDANLFTHIIYGFGKVNFGSRENPKFEIAPFEANDMGPGGQYQQVNDLKKKHPHLKTLLAIGGWTFNDPPEVAGAGSTAWVFSTMVSKPEYREYFINHAIRYLRAADFDGLDLDWEYPTDEGRGGAPEDRDNFTALCREFKAASAKEAKKSGKEPMLLTMAAGAHKSETLDLTELGQILDWVNLMAYDFYGGWAEQTGMNAPLSGDPTANWYIAKAVDKWLEGGIPPERLVLGMPSYGRSFKGVKDPAPGSSAGGAGIQGRCTAAEGFLAYTEVVALIESGQYKTYWDPISSTPYAFNEGTGSWISYDDIRSINIKVDLVDEKELGGGMFWAIDLDDFHNDYPLITTVARRLRGPSAGPKKGVASK